ncbi:hypothetical protein GCM10010302_06110 [Streptomyces polychromogenes]|uniref:Glucose-methanol-choline oxidoreductase N-terminal domain-containing protein n=1 Tax=Streptomyces polychromogenes TaxID=67342 RepID=A0ABP3EQU8_9ACTN
MRGLDVVRFADRGRSVSVELEDVAGGGRHEGRHEAEIVIETGFVGARLPVHFTDSDLADLTAFIAARAAAEEDGAPPDGSGTDWPGAGRTAYLRLRAADPFVVEVRDPVQSGVTVTVPLNLPDGWATRRLPPGPTAHRPHRRPLTRAGCGASPEYQVVLPGPRAARPAAAPRRQGARNTGMPERRLPSRAPRAPRAPRAYGRLVAADYDVVIVGGGAAGCVLAARLSEDPSTRVLLLEAGPDYAELPAALRDGSGPHTASHDWGLSSEPGPAGRALALPRGKVIGGSSTTNAAFALRGSPYDFDGWAAHGNPGWGWGDVLPWFVAVETDLDFGHESYHGGHGPVPVRRYTGGDRSDIASAGQAAIMSAGVPEIADHNAPGAVGVGPLPVNEVGGERLGAASTYLAAARARHDLTVRGGAHVASVLLDRGRATGVRLADGENVHSDRVIVSAGTYFSPAILLRSGLRPAHELRALGIGPVLDLPGVGRNLADHPAVSIDVAHTGTARPRHAFQLVACTATCTAHGPANTAGRRTSS